MRTQIKEPFKLDLLVWHGMNNNGKELRVYDFIKDEEIPIVDLQRKALRKIGVIGRRYPEKVKKIPFNVGKLEVLLQTLFQTRSELLEDVINCIDLLTDWGYYNILHGILVLANMDRYELRRTVRPYTIVKRNNQKNLSDDDSGYYTGKIISGVY